MYVLVFFFFFKQKTAYEMRISDWSSDVCSSDLLKERLAGSDDWAEFGGKSACWPTLGGLGTIDDNILDLPDGEYRGFGIRAFDPATRTWSIWWVDGRNPTRIDPPVVGRFDGDEGVFNGSSEEHTSALKSLMRISDHVICLKT